MQTLLLAAAAASAFNLQCDIATYDIVPGKQLSMKDKREIRVIYRIDLDQKRWCRDDCTTTEPIEAVFERHIVLSQTYTPKEQSITKINREDGTIEMKFMLPGIAGLHGIGKCDKRPFTGFPKLMF